MTEMVERVARAIYESYDFVKPWDHPDTVRIHHRHTKAAARAAIEAMREPTYAMCFADTDAGPPTYNDPLPPGMLWGAMIDVALQEEADGIPEQSPLA